METNCYSYRSKKVETLGFNLIKNIYNLPSDLTAIEKILIELLHWQEDIKLVCLFVCELEPPLRG